ncbi:formylglycine-generating enzyme family protein [Thiofilum flexile]|uniref:formylglycine-generating enzyme family protein n=1 Tax=Thiofilum flexile TaxID=125627 RepID=UPI0003634C6A|nr:formylglycine-generating enzyme family protein [Thiofilum flexile]
MAWKRLAQIQLAGEPAEVLDRFSQVLGYEARTNKNSDKTQDEYLVQNFNTFDKSDGEQKSSFHTATAQDANAWFLRIRKIIRKQPADDTPASYLYDPDWRFTAKDREQEGTYQFASPPALFSISRLTPLLLNALGQQRAGSRLNHRLLTRRISKGLVVRRLPYLLRQRWAKRLLILVDCNKHLEPYWSDFAWLVGQLRWQLGEEALQVLQFDQGRRDTQLWVKPWPAQKKKSKSTRSITTWSRWRCAPSAVPVLILSDLGAGDSTGNAVDFWQQVAVCLRNHNAAVLNLSPLPHSVRDYAITQHLQPTPFNDGVTLPRYPARTGFTLDNTAIAMDKILAWLSAVPIVDVGLLRRLRLLLCWGASDIEGVIWNHADIQRTALGIRIRSNVAEKYQAIYQKELAGSEVAQHFWDVVENHHQGAFTGLKRLEQWHHCLLEQGENQAVRDYLQQLAASIAQGKETQAQYNALLQQGKSFLSSLPALVWQGEFSDLAYDLYALVNEQALRAGQLPEMLPSGFELERAMQRVLSQKEKLERERWQVVQCGSEGEFSLRREQQWPGLQTTVLAEIESLRGLPPVLDYPPINEGRKQIVRQGVCYTLPEGLVGIESSSHWLELEVVSKPSWARRIWRNAEGLFAEIMFAGQSYQVRWQERLDQIRGSWDWTGTPFGYDAETIDLHHPDVNFYADLTIKNITQRFRWIEPDTFMMGSPKDEEGRYDNEDLHQVTLTQGFWLADTTVTQALWQGVMGDNPSHFKENSKNPVEQVSWNDCRQFIRKLNNMMSGLNAQLPSEAQWEYACRAGTTTPFSFGGKGDLNQEKVNYSGKWDAADSSGSTKPVKSYPPNDWGLYEMHGNVLEWCQDVWQPHLGKPAVTELQGQSHVIRGGSWANKGRNCRSAFRLFRSTPDDRDSYLGLRLSLGHTEFKPGGGAIMSGVSVEVNKQHLAQRLQILLGRFRGKS